MISVNVHYRVAQSSTVNTTKKAAESALKKLHREWAPEHWRLEAVAETGANLDPIHRGFSVTFTVSLQDEDWHGDRR